jgi:hypothetical protein
MSEMLFESFFLIAMPSFCKHWVLHDIMSDFANKMFWYLEDLFSIWIADGVDKLA